MWWLGIFTIFIRYFHLLVPYFRNTDEKHERIINRDSMRIAKEFAATNCVVKKRMLENMVEKRVCNLSASPKDITKVH